MQAAGPKGSAGLLRVHARVRENAAAMTPLASRKPARQAFTLAELIAVLALLAILASLAWPRLLGMLTRSELTEAGKRVRAALVQTRLRAIESGQPWVFRFTPGSGRFEVLPASTAFEEGLAEPEMAASRVPRQQAGLASLHPAGQGPKLPRPLSETLPGGVVFEPNEVSALSGSEPAAVLASAGADSEDTPSQRQPDTRLVFQANGRAPDARMVLVSLDGRRLEVAFRGLTGTARLGLLPKTSQSSQADELAGAAKATTPRRTPSEAAVSESWQAEPAPPADAADSDEAFWSEFLGEGVP